MGDTEISWTHRPGTRGRTWNPTQGCRILSEGCRNCYAMRMAARFAKDGWSKGLINLSNGKWNGNARLAAHKLADPLSWREPSTVFVNSMSDLFYDGFSFEEIAAVFGIMAATPQHTYIILTKRAKRMREWFAWAADGPLGAWTKCALECNAPGFAQAIAPLNAVWPLPNVWLGVSVERQDESHRIDDLLMTPAAIRLLSLEPLLGPIDLIPWFDPTGACDCPPGAEYCVGGCPKHREWRHTQIDGEDHQFATDPKIDWVIVGCESGPGARPCSADWVLEIVQDCERYGVAAYVKQLRASADPDDGPLVTIGKGAKDTRGVIERPYIEDKQYVEFPA